MLGTVPLCAGAAELLSSLHPLLPRLARAHLPTCLCPLGGLCAGAWVDGQGESRRGQAVPSPGPMTQALTPAPAIPA